MIIFSSLLIEVCQSFDFATNILDHIFYFPYFEITLKTFVSSRSSIIFCTFIFLFPSVVLLESWSPHACCHVGWRHFPYPLWLLIISVQTAALVLPSHNHIPEVFICELSPFPRAHVPVLICVSQVYIFYFIAFLVLLPVHKILVITSVLQCCPFVSYWFFLGRITCLSLTLQILFFFFLPLWTLDTFYALNLLCLQSHTILLPAIDLLL